MCLDERIVSSKLVKLPIHIGKKLSGHAMDKSVNFAYTIRFGDFGEAYLLSLEEAKRIYKNYCEYGIYENSDFTWNGLPNVHVSYRFWKMMSLKTFPGS